MSAGGTRERVDAVRYLGNRSSGKMGFAVARQAAARGAEVVLTDWLPSWFLVVDPALVEVEVDGVRLIDWITELVAGGPPADVHCRICR